MTDRSWMTLVHLVYVVGSLAFLTGTLLALWRHWRVN